MPLSVNWINELLVASDMGYDRSLQKQHVDLCLCLHCHNDQTLTLYRFHYDYGLGDITNI